MIPDSHVIALEEIRIIDRSTRETISGFSNSAGVISAASVALSIFALGLGGITSFYAVAILMMSVILGFRVMNVALMQETMVEPNLIQKILFTHNSYLSLYTIVDVRMKLLEEISNLSYKVQVIWTVQLAMMVLGTFLIVVGVMI